MKIILTQPYYTKSFSIVPPLGLGYLASSLMRAGHKVQIVDCIAKNINTKKFLEIIESEHPDLIGVTILSVFFKEAKELISQIRENSSTHIVIGGHHVTALPIDSMKATKADFAVVGEGEETIVELVNKIDSNQSYSEVRGICYKSTQGEIIINPARSLIANLDNIPSPAWDLLDLHSYPPLPHGTFYKRFPSASIITTRGCPFDCIFCAARLSFGRKLRMRSAEKVVEEIGVLYDKFGIKEFHFDDDNFTFSKAHIMSICQEIIDRELDIVWSCPNGVRIDLLDNELLKKMRESGCYRLSIGIESSSQDILDRAKKHLDINLVPDQIKAIKKTGIEVEGFFILGLPGETEKTICNTIKFALKLPLDLARFHIIIPLPGTKIYEELFKSKNSTSDFSEMTAIGESQFKNQNPDFLGLNLVAYQKKANRIFYLNPKNFIKILLKIKSEQIFCLIKRMFKIL